MGKELIECTRQRLLLLFTKEAAPLRKKAGFIIQEWLESKQDPVFWSSLWVTLPEYITEPPLHRVCFNKEPKLYLGVDEIMDYAKNEV